MLYVNVTYTMPRENRDKFIDDIRDQRIMELTRTEKGNVAYEFSVPLERDDQVFLREIWSEAGFEEHKSGGNIRKLAALKDKYDIATSIVISRTD